MSDEQPELPEEKPELDDVDRAVADVREKRLGKPLARPASRGRIVAVGLLIALFIYLLLPASPPPAPVAPATPVHVNVPAAPPAPPPVPQRQYEESIGPPVPPIVAKPAKRRYEGKAVIALVIDDCGISNSQTGPALDLPVEATLAFLPYGRATPKMSAAAQERGHDVMLHLPMQPLGHDDPGPDAILTTLTAEEITRRATAALEAVPGAIGVNNHMGSAATADPIVMRAVMQALADKNVFFLDSYTNSRSVGYKTALAAGLSAARRDVFLDDTITPEAINAQLERLEIVAHKQGSAIAIGHPHPATLEALRNWLPTIGEKGLSLVRIKDLTVKGDKQ